MADTLIVKLSDKKQKIDSVVLRTGNKTLLKGKLESLITLPVSDLRPGNGKLEIEVRLKKGKVVKRECDIMVVSDIIPDEIKLDVIKILPHDTSAFVQGLLYREGMLYESDGLKGRSRLRIIDAKTGNCLKDEFTDPELFNEGIAFVRDTLYMLTWKDSLLLRFDQDLNLLSQVPFRSEGWGLLSHDDCLFLSNGTNEIIKYDPVRNVFSDTLRVADNKGPVYYLNELEWIEGMIWANIYGKESIAIIDPVSGKVKGVLNGRNLIDRKKYPEAGVMNGIALDPATNMVYLTGKNWPFIKVCRVRFED